MTSALIFLYLVLAIAIIFIAVYLCILMNQATKVLKNTESITKRVDNVAASVESVTKNGLLPIISSIGTILSKTTGYFSNLLSENKKSKK
ncbi:MAG: hypothetical protein WC773_04450 [Patescibacteria group bacterium]|jgi:hypothetical protein